MSDAITNSLELLEAAGVGDLGAVQRLLAEGTDPNTWDVLSGYTALVYAATAGHLEVAAKDEASAARHAAEAERLGFRGTRIDAVIRDAQALLARVEGRGGTAAPAGN